MSNADDLTREMLRAQFVPTAAQIEEYIEAADLELGPRCCDDWVEACRRILRDAARTLST